MEFRVLDNGKVLTLAPGIQGAKLKRWKVGCTNKTTAKQQEAIIKTQLLSGTMLSGRVQHVSMTLGARADVYKNEAVQRIRSYRERCQRIDQTIVPFFAHRHSSRTSQSVPWRRFLSQG